MPEPYASGGRATKNMRTETCGDPCMRMRMQGCLCRWTQCASAFGASRKYHTYRSMKKMSARGIVGSGNPVTSSARLAARRTRHLNPTYRQNQDECGHGRESANFW